MILLDIVIPDMSGGEIARTLSEMPSTCKIPIIFLSGLNTPEDIQIIREKIGDYNLILSGEMTLDSLSAQVGPRLAELLDLPQVTYVKRIEIVDGMVRAERDLEDVDEVVEVGMPAVVSMVREVNEPRIPSLMNIMKAKRKPTEEWDAAAIGLSADELRAGSSVEVLKVEAPVVERKRIVIEAKTVEEATARLAEAIVGEGVLEG